MKTGRRERAYSMAGSLSKVLREVLSPRVRSIIENGMARHRAGELAQAEVLYRDALRISPNQPDALNLLGLIAHRARKYAYALELFDKAIAVNPRYEVYFSNRGNTLTAMGQNELALKSFDQAIVLKPDYAEAFFNRGALLHGMKQYPEALASYDRAISLQPDLADAHNNRGNTLRALLRYDEALESFEKAAQLKPNCADTDNNLGNVLLETRKFPAAIHCYEKALSLKPDLVEAWCNRGLALQQLRQFQAAIENYDKALEFDPKHALAWNNRGMALLEIKQYQRALESFDQALSIDPEFKYLDGMRVHMKRHLCDWADAASECGHVEEAVAQGARVTAPFCLLSISGSPALQKKAAEIYVQEIGPGRIVNLPIEPRLGGRKIRVGYFSSDFRDHPVGYLMAEVFERHDKEDFEVLGFSTGPKTNDKMRTRISKAMDRFVDVHAMADAEIVRLGRSLKIDIAIDLNGLSYGNRTRIFAQRAAPIQVNYLGYPGTMGADFMDYLVADETLIPVSSRQYYAEKIVYMPDCFQANDSRCSISTRSYTRAQQGLPEAGFVYCCFNNSFKIAPQVFDVWMRILGRVDGSVLWLWAGDAQARENLLREAERRGISADRLIFASTLPLAEHLRRQQLAGLFLDTLPFNAGATASPALWAGLPVLTCMGETFAGRMAASLLRAVRMPELITETESAYEDLAVEIGADPALARELKEKLDRNRLTTPLFDVAAFTQNLESAYTEMHERCQSGLPPDHIRVVRKPISRSAACGASEAGWDAVNRQADTPSTQCLQGT